MSAAPGIPFTVRMRWRVSCKWNRGHEQANKTHDRKIEKHGPNLIPRYRANRINNGQVWLLLFDDNNWNANLWTRQLAPVFCFAK